MWLSAQTVVSVFTEILKITRIRVETSKAQRGGDELASLRVLWSSAEIPKCRSEASEGEELARST